MKTRSREFALELSRLERTLDRQAAELRNAVQTLTFGSVRAGEREEHIRCVERLTREVRETQDALGQLIFSYVTSKDALLLCAGCMTSPFGCQCPKEEPKGH